MIDPRWDRWILASVNTYLTEEIAKLSGITVYPEGLPDVDRHGAQEWVEIRLSGPDYTALLNDEWRARVDITLLVRCIINEEDAYRIRDYKGVISKILSGTIPLYEYGTDDTQQFGCLQLLGRIVTTDYQRSGVDKPMQESLIDCRGFVDLTGI